MQLILEPRTSWRRPKEMPMIGQPLPDLARSALDSMRRSIDPRNTERLERNALRVQHPNDVMIRRDDERRRVHKRIVGCEDCGIDMPMRRDDRQRARLIVQRARVTPDCRIRIEVAILVK